MSFIHQDGSAETKRMLTKLLHKDSDHSNVIVCLLLNTVTTHYIMQYKMLAKSLHHGHGVLVKKLTWDINVGMLISTDIDFSPTPCPSRPTHSHKIHAHTQTHTHRHTHRHTHTHTHRQGVFASWILVPRAILKCWAEGLVVFEETLRM